MQQNLGSKIIKYKDTKYKQKNIQFDSPDKTKNTMFQYFEQPDGAYHGQMDTSYRKNGVGIFINDSSLAYIGDWKSDQINGDGLLIFPFGGYLLGEFNKNYIQGPGVMRVANTQIMVGNFLKSQLNGICFTFMLNQKLWVISEYKEGLLVSKLNEERGDSSTVPKSMTHYPLLQTIFERVIRKDFSTKNSLITVNTMENGYLYLGIENDGLGVLFHPNPFTFGLKMGYFRMNNLDGLGRHIKDNGDISDGLFQMATLFQGFKYSKQKNQPSEIGITVLSQFSQSFHKESGFKIPHEQMRKFRCQQHPLCKSYYERYQKGIQYFEEYTRLSLDDFQKSIFVQKSQRSSLLVINPTVDFNQIHNVKALVDSDVVESSLSLIKRTDYLFDITKSIQKIQSKQELGQSISLKKDNLFSSQSDVKLVESKVEIESIKIPQQVQLDQSVQSEYMKISKLRQTLTQQIAPQELKEKIFEPFQIVDFEHLRSNTQYSQQQTQIMRTKRSKKKIFQVESQPQKFLSHVYEYNQFLNISGLGNEKENTDDYNEN